MNRIRGGLTLMELLVVLAILAVLTTVAITTTETVIDQARYDATDRTLRNIEEAILGPAQQTEPDGSLAVSGFVSDVGRLPALEELVANPLAVPPYGPHGSPVEDAEVLLVHGWRGPYLRLAPGVPLPIDGWGRPINVLPPTQTTPLTFFSLGADGLPGGNNLSDNPPPLLIPPQRFTGTVSGHVLLLDAGGMARSTTEVVTVRLYGPGAPVSVMAANVGPGVYHYSLPTFIGRRVLRAYEGTTQKSRIVPLTVSPGGKSVDLKIQSAAAPASGGMQP